MSILIEWPSRCSSPRRTVSTLHSRGFETNRAHAIHADGEDINEAQVVGVFRKDGCERARDNVPIFPNGVEMCRCRIEATADFRDARLGCGYDHLSGRWLRDYFRIAD